MRYQLKIGAQDFAVEVNEQSRDLLRVSVNGTLYEVVVSNSGATLPRAAENTPIDRQIPEGKSTPASAETVSPAPEAGGGAVLAPIPGLILAIKVRVGDTVQAGQAVAVMEAMKMENELTARVSGVVRDILVQKGSEVSTGDIIMQIG